MQRKQFTVQFGHFMKPSALQHAMRIDRDSAARHRKAWQKPEFDPREADRWIGQDGRFTIPNSKENSK